MSRNYKKDKYLVILLYNLIINKHNKMFKLFIF